MKYYHNYRGLLSFLLDFFLVSQILSGIDCSAQELSNSTLMRYAGNIHQFSQIFPQEKVYLQFDNTAYFQGETIWFKAFVVTAATLQRPPSSVLYVELLSPSGTVLQRQKLKIVAGQCDGCFILVDLPTAQAREKRGAMNYPSGFYEVRAYTQHMLNFDDVCIFSRVLPVYTTPLAAGNYNTSKVLIKNESEWLPPRSYFKKEKKEAKVSIDFYPEGGHFVEGLPCNMIFKVSNEYGKGVDGTLILKDSGRRIETTHDGMGWFLVNSADKNKDVVFEYEGLSINSRLPKAERSGFSMILDALDNDRISGKIYRSESILSDTLGMTVTCRGELIDFKELLWQGQSTDVTFDTQDWPIGVCRVVLFSKEGHVLASRSVFHNNTDYSAPRIVVNNSEINRMPYSKNTVKLNLQTRTGDPFRDRFCLSIRDSKDFGTGTFSDLSSYLLVASDLKGYIHNPEYYLESTDITHRQAIDLLMLVQGWERYDWATMSGNNPYKERHRMERRVSLNGWIYSIRRWKPVDGVMVTASVVPDQNQAPEQFILEQFIYETGEDGYFGFDISDFEGEAKLTIALHIEKASGLHKEKNARIKMERSIMPKPKDYSYWEVVFERNIPKVSKFDANNQKLDSVIFVDIDGIMLDEVSILGKRQFIDYDTFKSFDIKLDTELQLDKGEYTTDVYGYLIEKGYQIFQDHSGQFINNLPPYTYTHNRTQYLTYPPFDQPLLVDMLDVKSLLVFDKPMRRPQIIPLIPLEVEWANTHPGADINSFEIATDQTRYILMDMLAKEEHERPTAKEMRMLGKRVAKVTGFSEHYVYNSPQYPDGPIEGQPKDYRRTLYWNPNVITDSLGYAEVEFYNNSYSTHFNVSGAGITASGTPYVLDQDF